MRMLPPPSPAVAAGTRPPATAAGGPPEGPAGGRPGVAGALAVGGVGADGVVLEDNRAVGGRPAGSVLHVLHEDGDAREEAGVLAPFDASVDLGGLAAGA